MDVVTLHVGAWITLGLIWWGNGNIQFDGLTVLDWTCVVVIVGCVQTMVVRLKKDYARAGGEEFQGLTMTPELGIAE